MKKKWMQKAVAAALMASLLAGQALPAAAADAARVGYGNAENRDVVRYALSFP